MSRRSLLTNMASDVTWTLTHQTLHLSRRGDSVPTLERATKFNPMFESDPVSAQYYRRYGAEPPQYYRRVDPDLPQYSSSASVDGSKDLGSDEMRHIYQNATLSKEVSPPADATSCSGRRAVEHVDLSPMLCCDGVLAHRV